MAGLTNQQNWDQYGIAIAGAVAPADATTRTGIYGLVRQSAPVTIASIGPVAPDPRNAPLPSLTVAFTEPVDPASFDWHDLTLTRNGGPNLVNSSVAVTPLTATLFQIGNLSGLTATEGTYVLTVQAGAIQDQTGNAGTGQRSETWTVDVTAPGVTINQASNQPDPSSSSPIRFQVVFSEPVTGFDASDVVLGGTASGLLSASVTGSATAYTIDVTGMTGSGTVVASIPAGAATDSANNSSVASTSVDNVVSYNHGNVANSAPSFTKGPDQSVNEDAGAQTVANWATGISAGPPNEAGQTLTFLITNNTNTGLFSVAPAVSSAGTLTFTPAANQSGSATISIVLKDDGGTANGGVDTSATQTFTISVGPVNDSPSFTRGADQVIYESAAAQTVPNWATAMSAGPGEAAQSLNFIITGNTNAGLFSVAPAVSPGGTLTYTPAPGVTGNATITLSLHDDGGTNQGGSDTSIPQSFRITIDPNVPAGPVEIGDNAGAGFAVSGAWTLTPGGYGGTLHYIGPGSGAQTATWSFPVTPGQYRVAATWSPHQNRATNAPYNVLDGATSLLAVRISQEQPPDDFNESGAAWEYLGGVLSVTGSTLVVQLSNDANEFVIADAIRVERVGDLPAEIQVLEGLTEITDGTGNVSFGSTTGGVPLQRTFTVRNAGLSPLTLQPVSVPSGFTVLSNLGVNTVLATGAQASFSVRLDAMASGNFAGQLSFANTDADENPFNFAISGTVAEISIGDNAGAGFAASGPWTLTPGGYGGTLHYIGPGSGAQTATWSFPVTPGQYRVAATWSPHQNRATNAPYNVLDGATSLLAVRISQEQPPDDFNESGAAWEYLGGVLSVTGSTLVVQLSNDANEFVIADAIRVERVGDLPAEIQVLEGLTEITDGTGNVSFGSTTGGVPLQRTFTVRNAGSSPLTLQPVSVPSGFTVLSNLGVNTVLATGAQASFSVRLDAMASGNFAGQLSFANTDADENPFNFAISGTVAEISIGDNAGAGFAVSGPWAPTAGGYGGTLHYIGPGSGAQTATWTFAVTPGQYRVAATWSPHQNRATNAPYNVLDGATSLLAVRISQEQPPDDFNESGAAWEYLGGVLSVTGSTLVVQLSNDANEFVIADAIRVERVGDLPAEIQVLEGLTEITDGTGNVSFGSTTGGVPLQRTFTVRNAGLSPLTLQPVSVPSGFTVLSNLGVNTVLATGAQASFSVRLDAMASGNFAGQLSFANTDADENPFNFAISGTVAEISIGDNAGAGFAASGPWTLTPGGYGGTLHYIGPGSGRRRPLGAFAVTPGQYRVAATWSPHQNRATNAPYNVLDGATSLLAVRISQEQPPDDFNESGAAWEYLGGVLSVTGSTLVVQLSNDANEFVIADAIRLERVGDLPAGPEIQVLEGLTEIADGTGSVSFGSTTGGVPLQRTFTVRNAGSSPLTLQPVSVPSGFTVLSNLGVNTVLATGAQASFSVRLDAMASGNFAGQLSFANTDADENPFNFAISGTVAGISIGDNAGAGFAASGPWTLTPGGYGGTLHYIGPGSGARRPPGAFRSRQASIVWRPPGRRTKTGPRMLPTTCWMERRPCWQSASARSNPPTTSMSPALPGSTWEEC